MERQTKINRYKDRYIDRYIDDRQIHNRYIDKQRDSDREIEGDREIVLSIDYRMDSMKLLYGGLHFISLYQASLFRYLH